jgi:mannose-6-phosphate isomerase-like protein (cupin superfamily)
MKIARLSDFTNGWFLGNFNPSLFKSEDFEVCVKNFKKGENEAPHFQRIATEVTVVLSGSVRMGEHILQVDDILTVYKGEVCDFEALTDCKVLGVKFPSLPEDKVLA